MEESIKGNEGEEITVEIHSRLDTRWDDLGTLCASGGAVQGRELVCVVVTASDVLRDSVIHT